MSIAEQAEGSRDVGVAAAAANDFDVDRQIRIARYAGEQQMQTIMGLIDEELSEPYTVFTYRYFLNQWPQLCFLAHYHPVERAEKGDLHSSIWSTPSNDNSPRPIGVVIGKLDRHMKGARYLRGYIGMISVQPSFRGKGIATRLLHVVLREMVRQGAQEIVLETETDNVASLCLYESLGFMREKRLFNFYLNGKDCFRLVLEIPRSAWHSQSSVSPTLPYTMPASLAAMRIGPERSSPPRHAYRHADIL